MSDDPEYYNEPTQRFEPAEPEPEQPWYRKPIVPIVVGAVATLVLIGAIYGIVQAMSNESPSTATTTTTTTPTTTTTTSPTTTTTTSPTTTTTTTSPSATTVTETETVTETTVVPQGAPPAESP
ncbi:hypothetical protein [Mycobacterium sp. ACS4331]|uniref:hypothetical protein n=1 Tax=Mycobacterium sp. ACS4331 TaxID=1834121 RepID=UPI0007FBB4AF|nr:hypothetical protein [Mycobacterium sp. ACS4331]OBF12956.1 hypothetical protein A5727_01315 [Mycobacterium sp. ACS4331]